MPRGLANLIKFTNPRDDNCAGDKISAQTLLKKILVKGITYPERSGVHGLEQSAKLISIHFGQSLVYNVGHTFVYNVGHSFVYDVGHSLVNDVGHSL